MKTVKDPEFLADARALRLDINPMSGEKVQAVVQKLFEFPPNIVERTKEIIYRQ